MSTSGPWLIPQEALELTYVSYSKLNKDWVSSTPISRLTGLPPYQSVIGCRHLWGGAWPWVKRFIAPEAMLKELAGECNPLTALPAALLISPSLKRNIPLSRASLSIVVAFTTFWENYRVQEHFRQWEILMSIKHLIRKTDRW